MGYPGFSNAHKKLEFHKLFRVISSYRLTLVTDFEQIINMTLIRANGVHQHRGEAVKEQDNFVTQWFSD